MIVSSEEIETREVADGEVISNAWLHQVVNDVEATLKAHLPSEGLYLEFINEACHAVADAALMHHSYGEIGKGIAGLVDVAGKARKDAEDRRKKEKE